MAVLVFGIYLWSAMVLYGLVVEVILNKR